MLSDRWPGGWIESAGSSLISHVTLIAIPALAGTNLHFRSTRPQVPLGPGRLSPRAHAAKARISSSRASQVVTVWFAMNILQALTAVALLFLGLGRTVLLLLPSLILKKPVRVDLPIPGFGLDIVFVADDKSAKVSPSPCATSRSGDRMSGMEDLSNSVPACWNGDCGAAAQALKASAASGRLHEVETKDLPKWVQLYFPGTRFFDQAADRWFIPFEGEDSHYATRRGAIVELLAKGYHPDEVTRVSAYPARVCCGL